MNGRREPKSPYLQQDFAKVPNQSIHYPFDVGKSFDNVPQRDSNTDSAMVVHSQKH